MCSDVRKHARCDVCGELEREVKGERTERSPPTGRAQKPNDEERYVRQRCCRTCKRIGSNAPTYGSASTASPRARKTRQGCEKSRQRACSEISNPRNVIRLARWAGKERAKALAPLGGPLGSVRNAVMPLNVERRRLTARQDYSCGSSFR